MCSAKDWPLFWLEEYKIEIDIGLNYKEKNQVDYLINMFNKRLGLS